METLTRRRDDSDAIRLDAEGNWYYGSYPVLHERTIQFLHKNIARDDDGRFYLTGEDKPVYFVVEDAPYQVTKVERTIAGYLVTLTDESIELLDSDSLWTGKKDVLYCLVKGGRMSAKFSRPAYYDIVKDLKQAGSKYFLVLGSQKYPIENTPPKQLFEIESKPAKAAAKTPKKSKASPKKAKPAVKAKAKPKGAPKKKLHGGKIKKAAKRKVPSKKSKR